MPTYLNDVLDSAIGEMRSKSKLRLYQSDPEAWLWDVLGKRWYSKQSEIVAGFKAFEGVPEDEDVDDLVEQGLKRAGSILDANIFE